MFIFYDLFRIISYKVKRRIAVYKRNLFKKINFIEMVNLLNKKIYYCEENEKLLWEILRDDIIIIKQKIRIIQFKSEKFLRRLKRSW